MLNGLAASRSNAVLVGVNSYKHRWNPLRFAENDVNGLASVLQTKAGWPPAATRIWTGAQAKRNAVASALKETLSSAAPDELVILYLSLHASLTPRQELFLVTWDTSPDSIARTGLAASDILNWIDTSPAGYVVLLLDCCYSGAADVTRGQLRESWERIWDIDTRARLTRGTGRAVIASSWFDEPSLERQYGATGHGLFTYFVMEGLQGGGDQLLAVSRFGEVDAASLVDYIRRQIRGEQTPYFSSRGVFPVLVRRTEWMGEGAMSEQDTAVQNREDQTPMLKLAWRRADPAYKFNGFDLAPNGEFAVACFEDGSVLVVTGGGTRDLRTVVPASDWSTNRVLVAPSSSLVLLASRERKADPKAGRHAIGLLSLEDAHTPVHTLATWPTPISRIAFSPTGQMVAAARTYGELRVWDTNGRDVAQLARDNFADSMVNDFAFCFPDGKRIVAALEKHQGVYLWDINLESREPGSSRALKSLSRESWAPSDECLLLAVAPHGDLVACATKQGNIYMWNAQSGTPMVAQATVPSVPTTLAVSSASNAVACGTIAGEVHLFKAPTLELTSVVRFPSSLSSLVFTPESSGNLLAMAAADGSVRLRNYITGIDYPIERPDVPGDTFLRLSREGTRMLIANRMAGLLELWRLEWAPARR